MLTTPKAAVSIVAAAALSSVVSAQIPPGFTPSANVQLQVSYGKTPQIISPGQIVPFPNTTPMAPSLGLNEAPAVQGPYLLTMIDPDAPTPTDTSLSEILHWIQPDLETSGGNAADATQFLYTLSSNSDALIPFAPPMPPPGSAPHRYILLLWQQPAGFAIPAAFSDFSNSNRTNFDINEFAAAAGLQPPIAANYWLTSQGYMMPNQTAPPLPLPHPTGTGAPPGPTSTPPPPFPGSATRSVSVTSAFIGSAAVLLAFAVLL